MGVVVRNKGNHKYLIMTYHRGGNRPSSSPHAYSHTPTIQIVCGVRYLNVTKSH